jgi:hypothetical protein
MWLIWVLLVLILISPVVVIARRSVFATRDLHANEPRNHQNAGNGNAIGVHVAHPVLRLALWPVASHYGLCYSAHRSGDMPLIERALRSLGESIVREKITHKSAVESQNSKNYFPVFMILVFMALLVLLLPSTAAATDIYFQNVATGANNGTSCANGYSFNDPTHGMNASANNLAGNVLHVCWSAALPAGTAVYSAPNGGAAGDPIVIQLESGASINAPYLGTVFELNGHSHFVIRGPTPCGNGTGGSACTAKIQNTLNGAIGAACPGGPCTTSNSSLFVDASSTTSDVEVANLYIGPLCYEVAGDNACIANNQFLVKFYGFAGTLNVHDLYVTDCGWCLNGDGNNVHIWNTESNRTQHFVGMGNASSSAGETDFQFHDNWMHDVGNWTGSANHNNGVHLFFYGPGGSRPNGTYQLSGNLIYNNLCSGTWNGNTACIQFESGVENTYFFNNVCRANADSGQFNNGCFQVGGTNIALYNNTVIGKGAVQTEPNLSPGGRQQTVENNLSSTAGQLITTSSFQFVTGVMQPTFTFYGNNYYMNIIGSNGFGWCPPGGGSCLPTSSLPIWQSQGKTYLSSFDSTSAYSPSSTVNSDGSLQPGSPAIGFGVNLSSLCGTTNGPVVGLTVPTALCSDTTAGNTRTPFARPGPGGGNWDAGAYAQASNVSRPAPPTSVSAQAQ